MTSGFGRAALMRSALQGLDMILAKDDYAY